MEGRDPPVIGPRFDIVTCQETGALQRIFIGGCEVDLFERKAAREPWGDCKCTGPCQATDREGYTPPLTLTKHRTGGTTL
jgi:hypothetical protein